MGQDTSLRTVDILRYSDFRELESDFKYTQDIYYYLRKQELEYRPRPDYMQGQPDITSSMRTVLVDWLVEVAIGLHAETLFRAVAYVDRFLSTRPVPRRKLQLLGTASLFISCKFEEIYPPKVEEFAYITDGTCTEEQVVRMEEEVLKVLSFDMASPTINYFVQCYAQVDEAPAKVRDLAQYLCELALLDDVPYLEYLPSIIAGASLCLASHTLGRRPWGRELVEFSGYDVTDIRECICSLYSGWCTAPTRAQRAVHGKFKGVKFNQVADLEPSPTLPF